MSVAYTIEYVDLSFDSVVELQLKIIQVGCSALKTHSRIMCGPPHKKFPHPWSSGRKMIHERI